MCNKPNHSQLCILFDFHLDIALLDGMANAANNVKTECFAVHLPHFFRLISTHPHRTGCLLAANVGAENSRRSRDESITFV